MIIYQIILGKTNKVSIKLSSCTVFNIANKKVFLEHLIRILE